MIRKLSIVYLIALLIMLCFFVPFNVMQQTYSAATHTQNLIFVRQMGYASALYSFYDHSYLAVIDYKRLLIQIILLTLVFAIIYLILGNKNKGKTLTNN